MALKLAAPIPALIKREIDPAEFNDAYLPYLNEIFQYEVYYGGAGSGKSHFVAQKLALQLTSLKGRNLLCVRRNANDCRKSVFALIKKVLKRFHLYKYWHVTTSPSLRMVNRINGNEIIFDGMDNVENIKSLTFENGDVTDIWYEEATEERDGGNLRQLDLRLRDPFIKCRMILTFNPISSEHFIKNMIEDEMVPTGDCLFLKTTYKDNKFCPPQYRAKLERLKMTDPYRYVVYALGEWGVMGETVFDRNAIASRLTELNNIHRNFPPMMAHFTYTRDEDEGYVKRDSFQLHKGSGDIKIFREPVPRHPYVLALDTAGEGDDYHAAHVFDNITGEQVATFHSNMLPDYCVYQIYGLLRMYNNALYVPEINFDLYHLSIIRDLKYPNIYVREADRDARAKGKIDKMGFRTMPSNRQAILSACVEWVNNNIGKINDEATLREMLSFTRQKDAARGMMWAAEPGCHDDLVMSLAILLFCRDQQKQVEITDAGPLVGSWLPVELESAKEAGRITLRQKREYERKQKKWVSNFKDKLRRSKYA